MNRSSSYRPTPYPHVHNATLWKKFQELQDSRPVGILSVTNFWRWADPVPVYPYSTYFWGLAAPLPTPHMLVKEVANPLHPYFHFQCSAHLIPWNKSTETLGFHTGGRGLPTPVRERWISREKEEKGQSLFLTLPRDPFAIPKNAFFVLPQQQLVRIPENCKPDHFPRKVTDESGACEVDASHNANSQPPQRLT